MLCIHHLIYLSETQIVDSSLNNVRYVFCVAAAPGGTCFIEGRDLGPVKSPAYCNTGARSSGEDTQQDTGDDWLLLFLTAHC